MPLGAVPFPFGKCKICQDKATGVHYGVATCEGCKGFFKRSIPKADKYKCYFGGHCDISPQTRNRCKACRFQLCLQYGMSIDAVKMGRIPKTEKERALAEAGLGCSNDDCIDDNDGVNWADVPNGFRETPLSRHPSVPYHSSYSGGEDVCAQGGLGLDKYLPTVVQSQDNTYGSGKQNHENIPRNRTSSTCSSILSETKGSEIDHRNFNPQSSWGNTVYCDNVVKSEPTSAYCNDKGEDISHTISPDNHSHLRLSEQQCRKRSNDNFQGNFDHQSNNISALQHRQSSDIDLVVGCSPAKSSAQQYSICSTDNNAQNRVQVQSNAEFRLPSPNANSHFSSRVIEELVRQVLETPVSQIIQKRLNRLSSNDSSEVPLKALTLEDVQTDVNEMSAVHFDPEREESRLEDHANLASHKESMTSQSNSGDENCVFDRQFDVHQVSRMDDEQARKEVPGPMVQHTDIGPTSQHTDIGPTSQHTDIGPTSQHTDIGPTSQHTDRTHEEANESNNLIDVTMDRLRDPIKYLFSYQVHNKECYRKHISGEWQLPFTTAEKSRLKLVWDQLMQGVQYYNNQLMGFCCRVPGFSNFKKEDQEKLTMNSYMEIWMIIHAEFLCSQESYVLLNNQKIFYSKATMSIILGKQLTDLMLDFSKKFCQFNLSDFEIGILCAVRLTNPEVDDLLQKDKVELLNSHFLDIFASVLNTKQNSSRVAISLFQCLTVLKTIKTLQQEAIFDFNIDNPPEDVITENADMDEREV